MIMARYIYKYKVSKIPFPYSVTHFCLKNNFIPKINDTKITPTLIFKDED